MALGLEDSIISKRHWAIFACSAVNGEGLVDGIEWLVRDVAGRIFTSD